MINFNKILIKIGISLLMLPTIGLVSCNNEDFFELESPPVTEWHAVEDLEMAIGFPYQNSFFINEQTMGIMTHFIHNMMSDMVRRVQDVPGWGSPEIYGRETSVLVAQTLDKYRFAYQTIAATNKILDFLATDPFPDASTADKINNIDRIKGEALFLRAYNYFYLAQFYCPAYDPNGANDSKILSLRTSFPDEIQKALDNTPVTTKEVYVQVAADFKDAMELLPKGWAPGMPEGYKFGRATKHAASFYYAKVLLHMGNSSEALTVLNSILDDPEMPRGLEDDPLKVFSNSSETEPLISPEVILSAFYADALRGSTRHPVQVFNYVNKGFSDPNDFRDWWMVTMDNKVLEKCNILINGQWTEEWQADKRNPLWYEWKGADPEAVLKGKNNPDYITNPRIALYVGKDDPLLMVNKYHRVLRFQNNPLVRTSEAIILRAAIKAESGDGTGAAADLNVVRKRAWDESKSGTFVPLATATFEDVDIEWLKELAFEADRVSFLQMFRKPIGPAERDEAPIMPPYENFYWSIPIAETDFTP